MQYFYARFRDWNRIMIQTTLKVECEPGTERAPGIKQRRESKKARIGSSKSNSNAEDMKANTSYHKITSLQVKHICYSIYCLFKHLQVSTQVKSVVAKF